MQFNTVDEMFSMLRDYNEYLYIPMDMSVHFKLIPNGPYEIKQYIMNKNIQYEWI